MCPRGSSSFSTYCTTMLLLCLFRTLQCCTIVCGSVAGCGLDEKRGATPATHKGAPGFQKSPGVDFFFKAVQDTPPPLLGQKRICQEYSEKNISGSGICSKKNIYEFGIYYKNIVYLSMPCIVSLLSTPVKPYVHALCL